MATEIYTDTARTEKDAKAIAASSTLGKCATSEDVILRVKVKAIYFLLSVLIVS